MDAADRERAVVLALLYRIEEISRTKLLEVARAVGSLPPGLTTEVQAVEHEPFGNL